MPLVRKRSSTKIIVNIPRKRLLRPTKMKRIRFMLDQNLTCDRVSLRPAAAQIRETTTAIKTNFFIRFSDDENGFFST